MFSFIESEFVTHFYALLRITTHYYAFLLISTHFYAFLRRRRVPRSAGVDLHLPRRAARQQAGQEDADHQAAAAHPAKMHIQGNH